jgi:hypothetical protein
MVERRNLVSLCKPCHAARDWLHFDAYRTIRGILSRSGGPRRGPLRPRLRGSNFARAPRLNLHEGHHRRSVNLLACVLVVILRPAGATNAGA